MKFAYAGGYIVTANEDGRPHLNSKIVCKVDPRDFHEPLMTALIEQANAQHDLMEDEDYPLLHDDHPAYNPKGE